jgi:hypothetical protein
MTNSAPPMAGHQKAGRRFPGAGLQNSWDDEDMPVICPTCQIRRKYPLLIPQAMWKTAGNRKESSALTFVLYGPDRRSKLESHCLPARKRKCFMQVY